MKDQQRFFLEMGQAFRGSFKIAHEDFSGPIKRVRALYAEHQHVPFRHVAVACCKGVSDVGFRTFFDVPLLFVALTEVLAVGSDALCEPVRQQCKQEEQTHERVQPYATPLIM